MGGTTIQQPQQPSVSSSIGDYVENYPRLFQLQQQYAPQEAAQQVSLAQRYAAPLGQAYQQAQAQMYPQETMLTNALTNQVLQGMGAVGTAGNASSFSLTPKQSMYDYTIPANTIQIPYTAYEPVYGQQGKEGSAIMDWNPVTKQYDYTIPSQQVQIPYTTYDYSYTPATSNTMTTTGGGVPEWQRQQYRSDLNANLGTNVGSPIAADYMSRGLLQQQQDWQRYYQNLGLSITGRQPIYTANTPQTTNQTAGFTPQGVMSYNQQGYNTAAGLYANQPTNSFGGLGAGIGALGGGLIGTSMGNPFAGAMIGSSFGGGFGSMFRR